MNREKFSLTLTALCLIGAHWVKRQHPIGYVSTALFLLAALLSAVAYFKASKDE